jgi:hypothetical protein
LIADMTLVSGEAFAASRRANLVNVRRLLQRIGVDPNDAVAAPTTIGS